MRVIFSRKGFDSAAGGCPSPIIAGRPLSMPIPAFKTPTPMKFGDLNGPYGELVDDLTAGKLTRENWCHLDPDIMPSVLPRSHGWRGALGQVAAAQGHLAKQCIQPGDLFVFWGLFPTKKEHGNPGNLSVGVSIGFGVGFRSVRSSTSADGSHAARRYPWLLDHPHVRPGWGGGQRPLLSCRGTDVGLPPHITAGARRAEQRHCLSVFGATITTWAVPQWLHRLQGLWYDIPMDGQAERRWHRANRRPWTGIRRRHRPGRDGNRLAGEFDCREDRMSRIWRYVLATDNGMAPCSDAGILTLNCCKPMIRRRAQRRMGHKLRPEKQRRSQVAWVGQIAEVLSLGEYEARFSPRRDALYRRAGYEPNGSERLTPVQSKYHVDHKSQQRDCRGKNALIFDPFWYWGQSAVAAPPFIAVLAHYFVGQTTRGSTPDRVARLEAWVRSVAEPGVHGEPRKSLQTGPAVTARSRTTKRVCR